MAGVGVDPKTKILEIGTYCGRLLLMAHKDIEKKVPQQFPGKNWIVTRTSHT